MNRVTWLKSTVRKLTLLLAGGRVCGLALADVGDEDEARRVLHRLKLQLAAMLPAVRVASLPLSPVWSVA